RPPQARGRKSAGYNSQPPHPTDFRPWACVTLPFNGKCRHSTPSFSGACMRSILIIFTLLAGAQPACAQTVPFGATKGTVRFVPLDDQTNIPQRYRLAAHTFDWTMTPRADWPVSGVEMFAVTFPSPVESKHPEN